MRLDTPISEYKPIERENGKSISDCIRETFGVTLAPIADGKFHRFATDSRKRNSLDGFYILHECQDGFMHGNFGSWRDNTSFHYSSTEKLTENQKELIRQDSLKVEEERKRLAKEVSIASKIEYESLNVANNNPYLERKNVKGYGLFKQSGDSLVVPVMRDDAIQSLQYIAPDGSKRFKTGGQLKGGYFVIPPRQGAKGLCFIAEGVATALSVFEATGEKCVVAFNCGNLAEVTKAFKDENPTIIADNDESKAGEEAARKSGARYVLIPQVGMDANDYANAYGTDALRALLIKEEPNTWLKDMRSNLMQPQPLKWLIKGWIPQEGFSMIHGQPSSGKSFVALDMMLTLSTGIGSWHGYKAKKCNVLYLCGEGFQGLPARVVAWLRAHSVEDIGTLMYSSFALALDDSQEGAFAYERITALNPRPDLIVIDTFNRFYSGDENSAQEVRVFLDFIGKLQSELDSAILLVHHTGVSADAQGRARGSSALRGAVDTEISVENLEGLLTLTQRKQKDAEMLQPMNLQLKQAELEGWLDEDGETVTSAIVTEPTEGIESLAKENTTEEMQFMICAWLRGKKRRNWEGFPFIAKQEIKAFLSELWDLDRMDTEAEKKKVQTRIRSWMRETSQDTRPGLNKLLSQSYIEPCKADGEEGYRVIDQTMLLELRHQEKLETGF